MEFLNPNVAGDMAQLLQHNQEKHIPVIVKEDSASTVLACIPLHGDQLFEERASGHSGMVWIQLKGLME